MSIKINSLVNISGQSIFSVNANLPLADSIKLFSALKVCLLELGIASYEIRHQCHLRVFDCGELVESQLRDVVTAFQKRDKHAPVAIVTLPTFSMWHRFCAWLMPIHEAKIAARVGELVKHRGRFQFTIELGSTTADYSFLRSLKSCAKSASCSGSKVKLRGKTATVSARSKEVTRTLHICTSKLNWERAGRAEAVCPLMLWLHWLFTDFDE